ncbi:MerR family transcriptional regulator [Priestia megaterium]
MTGNRIRDYRKPGEVAKILGIDTDLLRKYTDHFNIQTERSNEDGTGFRKYKDEHIAELKEIVRLIKQEGFSWDQVLAWRNGEEEIHHTHEERGQVEKKIDMFFEKQMEHNEKQEEFNLASAQNFDMLMKYVRGLEQKVTGLEQHLLETKTEVKELKEENGSLQEQLRLIEAPKENKTDQYSEFREYLKELEQQRKKEDEERQAREEARDRMFAEELKAIKQTAATNQDQKRKKFLGIF